MAGALPDFRLLNSIAYKERKQRRQSANEEHRTPSPARKHEEVADRSEQVPGSVAFLQQTRQNAATTRRRFFHRQRRTDSPFAAHPDSEQSAQDEKRRVIGSQSGQHFHHREEDEVDHQRELATITVGHQAEDESPDGPERERHRDSQRKLSVGLMKILRDRRQREDDKKEVERVERPAEEAGEDRSAMAARSRAGE